LHNHFTNLPTLCIFPTVGFVMGESLNAFS